MTGPSNLAQPSSKNQDRASANNAQGIRGQATPVSGQVGIVGRCAFAGSNVGSNAGGNSNPGSLTRQPGQQPHHPHLLNNSLNMGINPKGNANANGSNIENDYASAKQPGVFSQIGQ